MSYTCELGQGQKLQIENPGAQTAIALINVSLGQQQSQQTSVETGAWILPPAVFRTPEALIVRIEAQNGQFFVQVQAHSLSLLNAHPSLIGAVVLPLDNVPTVTTWQAMPPMPPMKPMQMQMGNMAMSMGTPSTQGYCSQCGKAVAEGDRFCSGCGHQLNR